ncbi:MAG: ABC transporter permease [Candidatus Kerfeldbacteria bacterium]
MTLTQRQKQAAKIGIKIVFLVFLVFVWWVIYKIGVWPAWLFPSPMKVFTALYKGFESGLFFKGVLISMKRIGIGFGFSLMVGTLIGVCTAKVKIIKETVGFLVLGLQTLPSICWLPLALLWFGLNERAIIFVVIMGSVLSMSIAVDGAVSNIPKIYIRAGRMLGVRRSRMFTSVLFPAILPSFLTGVKQAWSFAWRSLMSGEMLFITVGLGQLLMMGRELNDMSRVMAIMLVIILIGIIFDKLVFGLAESNLRRRWGV